MKNSVDTVHEKSTVDTVFTKNCACETLYTHAIICLSKEGWCALLLNMGHNFDNIVGIPSKVI